MIDFDSLLNESDIDSEKLILKNIISHYDNNINLVDFKYNGYKRQELFLILQESKVYYIDIWSNLNKTPTLTTDEVFYSLDDASDKLFEMCEDSASELDKFHGINIFGPQRYVYTIREHNGRNFELIDYQVGACYCDDSDGLKSDYLLTILTLTLCRLNDNTLIQQKWEWEDFPKENDIPAELKEEKILEEGNVSFIKNVSKQ